MTATFCPCSPPNADDVRRAREITEEIVSAHRYNLDEDELAALLVLLEVTADNAAKGPANAT
jgi:hypothetical protein